MTDNKVLNFWNNVKDNLTEVEEGKDSSAKNVTFLAGDSLSFSFEARFITGGVSGVKQSLYTALVVEYEDGTSFSVGEYKMTNGNCAISAPRNFASRPKYMSGFVYYSDDDSTAMARLLLNRISLKRIHAPKSVEAADKK